jgi:UDP:flavonoid glycosyltransferase YjiC (YdhE family)
MSGRYSTLRPGPGLGPRRSPGSRLASWCWSHSARRSKTRPRALQQVLDALGTLDVHGVVTLGPGMAGIALREPANVALLESAPHDAVMREAALVITHGGHGTVTRALVHGLPMLVLPMGRDQHDNAARVVARGAGLSLDAAAPNAAIREGVRRLLNEQGFRAAAQELGRAVAADLELPTLVEELERIAALGTTRAIMTTRLCA